MSFWRHLTRGFRVLVSRPATDRDIDDEVRHYLDEATVAHRARGLSPAAAVRAARVELGGVTSVTAEVREYGWEKGIEALLADLRYAARRLRGSPGFTAVTVGTLALGIGATTAIYSAVSPILFEPLPYPDAGRITTILEIGPDGSRNAGTFGMYRGLAERNRSFDALAVLKPWQPIITSADQPERLEGQRVSASFFQVLGVSPHLGRDFQAPDDRLNGPNLVILSDALWRRRFAAESAIIGREITLDGTGYLIIGVMPSGFENVLAPSAELWAPLQYDMSLGPAWGHHLRTIGRLRAGVGIEQASQEVGALGRRVLSEQRPASYDPTTLLVATSLRDDLTRGVKQALLAILGGVTLVLVIACVNVTNLLLARGVHRRGEFALRAALGAARNRLIRQLLVESLLMASVAGVVGMAVAIFGVRMLVALGPPDLPRLGAIRVDGAVFAFGLGLTTLIGLAFGVIPALQAARSDPHRDLQHSSRRAAGGHRRSRSILVVVEVALALVLLVSSGLLLRSLSQLFAVELGFDSSGLLTMQVQTSGPRFTEVGATTRFFEDALDAVQRQPGVKGAALTGLLPLSGDQDEYGAHFEATPTQPAQSYSVYRYAVSTGYLETMGIPVRHGRLFNELDRAGAPRVALISESLARIRFPGADPIGQPMRIGPQTGPPYTIVGVVGDVRQASLALSRSDAVYVPRSQWHWEENTATFVIRAPGDAGGLAPALRQAIWSVDKDQPIVRTASMDDLVAASAADRRFALVLFEAFALVALVLAGAGIYGVLSGSVAERTREIGVRAALGASRRDVQALVVRQGMTLAGLGIAIGVVAAIGASRTMVAMLFGVSALDPVTYVGVIVLLGTVAVVACWLPAWRAARVDPVTTLRME